MATSERNIGDLMKVLINDGSFTPQSDCKSQKEAVSIVRNDMLTLNKIVVESFEKHGLSTKSLPPHHWARNTGSNFSGDVKSCSMLILM